MGKAFPVVTYACVSHRGKPVILIQFEFDLRLINRVKQLDGAKWSATYKAWYVPDTEFYREKFKCISSASNCKLETNK